MGLLKSLFGRKKAEPKASVQIQTSSIQSVQNENPPLKKVPAAVQDLILLSAAEKYKIDEINYPHYFRHTFGIGFPNERFKELEENGLIRKSTSIETLPHLKVKELKTVATKFGLKVSGKKEELYSRIAENVSEKDLDDDITEKYWILTEKGKELLEENKYISFYMADHPYHLEDIGLDINAYVKSFSGSPKASVRDILWGEFNRLSLEYYTKGAQKGEFKDYCELLRTMSLFLEEENKNNDALREYMRYIFYKVNFEASLSALRDYSLLKNMDEAVDTLYIYSNLEIIADEVQKLSAKCGYNSRQLYAYMKKSFLEEKDTGVFSPIELADLVMCELNGDQDGRNKICRSSMRAGLKKLAGKK